MTADRQTIVVVEGNAAVQELTEGALRDAGHRVLATRNPLEALELARRVRIDVLVADVATLRQDGPALVSQLRAVQPSLPVVYLGDQSTADLDGVEEASVLRSPFSLGELEQAVGAAVRRR